MVISMRFAEKFTNIAVTTTYTFPLEMYEWSNDQDYSSNLLSVAGADYPYDPAGNDPWPMEAAEEHVKFMISATTNELMNTIYDTLVSTLRTIGLGKLWSNDSVNSRRWCYAKLARRPSILVGIKAPHYPEVICDFTRMSDWFAEVATTGSQSIAASTTDFNITNAGNVAAKNIVFRLRSNSAAGWVDPTLINLTNSMQVASTRDATSMSSELKIDTEEGSVKYSTDDGASYTADYSLAIIPAIQVGLLQLQPGVNSMRVTTVGTPNSTLEWSFYAQFA